MSKKRKNKGWRNDPIRHGLASKGVKTTTENRNDLSAIDVDDYISKKAYVVNVLNKLNWPEEGEELEIVLIELSEKLDSLSPEEEYNLRGFMQNELGWALGEQFEDIIDDPMMAYENPHPQFEDGLRKIGKGDMADILKFIRKERI